MGSRRKEVLRDGVWVDASTVVSAQDETPKADIRADGSLRRAGPGRRSMLDYFSGDDQRREVRRGELLGILEQIEYIRREHRWWRALWRWLRGEIRWKRWADTLPVPFVESYPGPPNMPAIMARAHFRHTVKPMLENVQAELDRRRRAKQEGKAGGDKK